MNCYNIRIIELDDRDVRLLATNGGVPVELSPDTRRLIIKMATGEPEKRPPARRRPDPVPAAQQRAGDGCQSPTAPAKIGGD